MGNAYHSDHASDTWPNDPPLGSQGGHLLLITSNLLQNSGGATEQLRYAASYYEQTSLQITWLLGA